MSTPDDTKPEFSVRDQFASRPDALAGGGAAAAGPAGNVPGPRVPPPGQPSLRRRLTPENLLQQIDWPRLGRALLSRAWLIGLVAAASTLLGLALALRSSRPKYEARTSLLYRTEHQSQTLTAAGSTFAIKGLSRTTALSLLRRTSNMESVRTKLQLPLTAEELRWRVETKSEKNSEIILLTVGNLPAADMAVKVANEAARVALADNREFYRTQAVHAAEQFQQQASLARQELETVSAQLITFQTAHRLLEAAADTKAFLDSIALVSERLSAARIADESQRVRIENYRRIIADLPDEVLREAFEDNPLKRRLSNTEVALMEARTRYGTDNPRVQSLEDEIKEMRRVLASKTFDENRERVYEPNPTKRLFQEELLKLGAEKLVLERTVQQVAAEMATVEKRYAYLPQQQLELAGFMQRRAAAGDMCHALEKSVSQARLAADLDLCDFELLETALTAASSRSRLALLLPMLALLVGLGGGTLFCLARELLDPRLTSSRQIELAYDIPCLGVVSLTEPAALKDAFLPVCREVYARVPQPPATPDGALLLAVLSAQPGEGKSTLAVQLARYWAALGVKTAYLDFDSAPNPALLVPPALRGLEDYLAERAAWENVFFMQDNVACFKCRADSGDLPERLHGKAMARLLDTLRSSYGCVVIDTPAFLEGRSAAMLAQTAGRSLWLTASPRTPRATVNQVFDELDHAGIRPLGFVLNYVAPTRSLHHNKKG